MNNSHSESYAAAGVDIEAGYKGVQLMKQHVARTMIPGVVSGIGGFGGLFAPDVAGMKVTEVNGHTNVPDIEDLKSSCTMSCGDFFATLTKAAANAK